MASSLRWLGHASFELRLGNIVIYIDPYFKGDGAMPRLMPSAIKDTSSIRECDIIALTHEHFDHFEKSSVLEIHERTYATVVGPAPVQKELRILDKFKVEVRTGDKFSLKGVNIEVIQAVHPQSIYPVGYIFEGDGLRVYHAGDTYEFTGMMNLKCDYSLLPMGGKYTMDPIDAEKAAKEIQGRYVVPMHYSTFKEIQQNANEFARGLEDSKKVKPILMKLGEQISLSK